MDNLNVDKAENDNPFSKLDQEIEENVRSNRFLRVSDSEESSAKKEEEVEIESKRNSSDGKDNIQSNEFQKFYNIISKSICLFV
jgi:DNA-directed RNA polymerase specialized sigma54-like protein